MAFGNQYLHVLFTCNKPSIKMIFKITFFTKTINILKKCLICLLIAVIVISAVDIEPVHAARTNFYISGHSKLISGQSAIYTIRVVILYQWHEICLLSKLKLAKKL